MTALLGLLLVGAAADPVHLSCYVEQIDGSKNMIDVTADEANGTVTTLVRSTGYTERLKAVFRPGDVMFTSGMFDYRIDRVDLSFVMTFRNIKSERRGKCEVGAVPKRAF